MEINERAGFPVDSVGRQITPEDEAEMLNDKRLAVGRRQTSWVAPLAWTAIMSKQPNADA